MFEFGRYSAGYDFAGGDSNSARSCATRSTRSEATISELRAKMAQLESSTVGQTREREEVQRTIGDLQAQVARANQELAFFRGIVTQNANSAEVKIQQARMVATATANKFRVRVTLVQPMKPDTVVSGVVVLSVDGEVDGKPGRADFATLSGGKRREIPFTFRYLENIEEEITMPPGHETRTASRRSPVQPARFRAGAAVVRLECRSAVGGAAGERQCSGDASRHPRASTRCSARPPLSMATWSSRAACISTAA